MSVARLALLALLALSACAPDAPRPHVVVISIDTLARDALAAFDPAAGPLPELDRLAAESVRYANALSSASWTLPAHASLLTGLYPDRHGATDRRVTLAESVETLAGTLARAGYETAAFTGGGFLDAKYGLGRGFHRYEAKTHAKQEPAETLPGLLGRVKGFLAERDGDRPLFLFLHTYAVHNYYDARAEAAVQSRRSELAPRKRYVDCVLGRKACPPEAWDDLRALYRAELELADAAFGELRAELERAGVFEDAYVVLLSDHGEGFEPERRRIHHGGRLHADQLRVPLLVRGPGLAPRDESTPVSLVDLMPTLLELAGAGVPAGLDGRSLAANLRDGAALAPRPLLAMEHYFEWHDGARETASEVRATPRETAVIDGATWSITGAVDELYALDDPSQAAPRVPGDAERAALRAVLDARPATRAASRPAEEDEGLGNALDALGYGGGDE